LFSPVHLSIQGHSSHFHSLAKTNDGGFILAGVTSSIDTSNFDFWLVKTDSAGNEQWNSTYGELDVYYNGTYPVPRYEDASSAIQTNDGGYAITGVIETSNNHHNYTDIWFIKTDRDGKELWSQRIGGDKRYRVSSIVQMDDSSFVLAGKTLPLQGTILTDAYLVKLDSSGSITWNKTFGRDDSNEEFNAMIINSEGDLVLAGQAYSTENSVDFWLVRVAENGTLLWERKLGTSGWDIAYSIAQSSDSGYILAGTTSFPREDDLNILLLKTDESGFLQNSEGYTSEIHGGILVFILVPSVIRIVRKKKKNCS